MPRAVKTKSGASAAPKRPEPKPARGAGAKRNKLYEMPEKIAEGKILSDLSKAQWRIGPSIGIGGFGEIYSACRVGEKSYDYVVKCEPHGNGPLFVEMHFYMRNAKLEDIERFKRARGLKVLGMPYMVGSGSTELNGQKHRFIVMPRYGTDVSKHFIANARQLPEGTAYRLCLQMLDVYEFVHECGYVHADLKAANILLGYGRNGGAQAYLVDYGLASHYTTKEFKPDPKKMHNGTIEYTSRDAHMGVATMRADLEILGYNLIEWLGVQLPWVRDKLLASPPKVQQAKQQFMNNIGTQLKTLFPKGVPAALVDYMDYVAKLQYNEHPDYERCRKIFASALKTLHISNSGDLDFKTKPTANNNTTSSSKQKRAVSVPQNLNDDSSSEMVCASDEDDGDVVFEKKTPVRTAPAKMPLKTMPKISPTKKVGLPSTRKPPAHRSPAKSPVLPTSPAPRRQLHSPAIAPYRSPAAKAKLSPRAAPKRSPAAKAKLSPRAAPKRTPPARLRMRGTETSQSNGTNSATPGSTSSVHLPSCDPSLSAKASRNFSPSIAAEVSSASRRRNGQTIINDQLTPNPRASKIYEFNFELDVSVDANVVVNVKRKKKTDASSSLSSASKRESPATRVKVRKIASADTLSDSPGTPAVTMKRLKR